MTAAELVSIWIGVELAEPAAAVASNQLTGIGFSIVSFRPLVGRSKPPKLE